MEKISFKSSIRGVAVLFFIFIFAGGCRTEHDKTSLDITKPNIIYILADDLGYGDIGSFGQKNIKTPNLDRLAEEGMRFIQHYSGSTVCAPSRAVLMTGLHTGHAPIRDNKEIMPIGQYPLQYGTVTFPKILQEAGYTTGAFGKWGLGPPDSEGFPSLQGFDRFFGLLDQYVGMILDKIEEMGIAENTLIIFTSDNGSYTEGGYHYSMHNSNAPLRGGKRDLYEGGIRVPTIAWWPGKIRPGSVSDHISGFQDMMPTFAELAGTTPPPQVDGISMVPELLGHTNKQEKHEYLYWEFHGMGGAQAVRMGKWKGVRLNVRQNRNAPIELYNLEEDIGEQNDLAGQHPHIIEKIDQIMRQAHVPSALFPLFEKN